MRAKSNQAIFLCYIKDARKAELNLKKKKKGFSHLYPFQINPYLRSTLWALIKQKVGPNLPDID